MFLSLLHDAQIDRLYHQCYRLAVGEIFIASSDQAIVFLAFTSPTTTLLTELQKLFPQSQVIKRSHHLHSEALAVIKQRKTQQCLPLYVHGTAFQRRVWEEVLKIPYAERATYSEIAKRINVPRAQRAVGTAVGSNPIALLIPCHRVVPADGSVGNYRWGSGVKANILALEAKL